MSKQKTAMMELILTIEANIRNLATDDRYLIGLEHCKKHAEELLEKEKDQIVNAYNASQMEEWTDEDGLRWLSFYADANQYYDWKYKKDYL